MVCGSIKWFIIALITYIDDTSMIKLRIRIRGFISGVEHPYMGASEGVFFSFPHQTTTTKLGEMTVNHGKTVQTVGLFCTLSSDKSFCLRPENCTSKTQVFSKSTVMLRLCYGKSEDVTVMLRSWCCVEDVLLRWRCCGDDWGRWGSGDLLTFYVTRQYC